MRGELQGHGNSNNNNHSTKIITNKYDINYNELKLPY